MAFLALILLPVAVFMDLRSISDQNLQSQATTLNRVISVFRSYYASNVVGRILAADGQAQPLHTYLDTNGGIPIPATLSIELGEEIGARQGDVTYRFVSKFPFRNRAEYALTPFEIEALEKFTANGSPNDSATDVSGSLLSREFTVATPVVMGSACVACHNNHIESPKKDWRVGDIRGIQTITVRQPLTLNLWSFKYLLAYLTTAGGIGFLFALMQFGLAREFGGLNNELEAKNEFLVKISTKLSKYLPPQIYESIFTGEKEVEISTERKKLTVFFSDIKDFTATTERLQPEELTNLLNEYFSEMSAIAERHGATIDKFIGDAIVAFFGDPVTRGAAEDARACLKMAVEMQARLTELNLEWLERGYEHPFKARIGINTGYCNVGNFGSESRMNYTIIGAEANLAARLESIAKPGGIVMSYETWALVRNQVSARPMRPTRFKGISREVVPYEVNMPNSSQSTGHIVKESTTGMELFLNTTNLDPDAREAARQVLLRGIAAIDETDS
ncbi:adenylate cyclase [Amylibacter kogurei]|uniref:Adenylate cyclase n=2 Tax=Paramylibacter kogurei TaxID=1889778 RepID=A0A2G5KB70_9RHOB|nr:adenylate cyclase [Amylibacter kogurei]